MGEQSAFGGHRAAVMGLDDLQKKAGHLHHGDVVGAGWFFHVRMVGDNAAQGFIKRCRGLQVFGEQGDVGKSSKVFHT